MAAYVTERNKKISGRGCIRQQMPVLMTDYNTSISFKDAKLIIHIVQSIHHRNVNFTSELNGCWDNSLLIGSGVELTTTWISLHQWGSTSQLNVTLLSGYWLEVCWPKGANPRGSQLNNNKSYDYDFSHWTSIPHQSVIIVGIIF